MDETLSNGVAIEHVDAHWVVQIAEHGEVSHQIFETEEFALNFAAGQRARLGLPSEGDQATRGVG